MRFKPGQLVVCKDSYEWECPGCGGFPGPKKDEVVTVKSYPFFQSIELCEYTMEMTDYHGFKEHCFEPLVSDEVLEKELESIGELVHE